MSRFLSKNRTGRAGELWPVLLLLVVVTVPTIGVLWFASVAMDNQQLATRQRLTDAYRSHLQNVQVQIDTDWQEITSQIDALPRQEAAQQLFADVLAFDVVDSVVCYNAAGELQYPALTKEPDVAKEEDPRWREAARRENEEADPLAAQAIYASIARDAQHVRERIIALQAQVRCLLKAQEKEAAVDLVIRSLGQDEFDHVHDAHARSVVANIELMAIENVARGKQFDQILKRLSNRVQNYGTDSLSPSHRLFLMRRLAEIAPGALDQAMIQAEELAAQFVTAHPSPSKSIALQRSQLPQVWQAATPSGRLVLLLKTDRVIARTMEAAAKTSLPSDVAIQVVPPAATTQGADFLSLPAGPRLPGWRLALSLRDGRQTDATAVERNRLHLWTGVMVVLFTSILGLFIVRAFRRQLRLANLKNDLVGTVSHELKTPLASMRLLVETLLDEDRLEEAPTREYLQLIAKENMRLSRLIENFLTFTRMEQGRQLFEFRDVSPADIVAGAVEAGGERFRQPDCSLTIEVDEECPLIYGDKDGLVTVLLNLLDNAYKYSDGPRDIAVRVEARNGAVHFAVSDNGIGLPRAASRRVFQRFYQVDQTLARQGQGCGLGLSIVDYIVRVHQGSVGVTSRLGEGSIFTVTLPVASDHTPKHAKAED